MNTPSQQHLPKPDLMPTIVDDRPVKPPSSERGIAQSAKKDLASDALWAELANQSAIDAAAYARCLVR